MGAGASTQHLDSWEKVGCMMSSQPTLESAYEETSVCSTRLEHPLDAQCGVRQDGTCKQWCTSSTKQQQHRCATPSNAMQHWAQHTAALALPSRAATRQTPDCVEDAVSASPQQLRMTLEAAGGGCLCIFHSTQELCEHCREHAFVRADPAPAAPFGVHHGRCDQWGRTQAEGTRAVAQKQRGHRSSHRGAAVRSTSITR